MLGEDTPADQVRENLLVAGVRLYYQAWGAAAARWVAEKVGLTEAQFDRACDAGDPSAFHVEPWDRGARVVVFPLKGMPGGQGGTH